MSGFTSYALLGLGNLGAPIATEVLASGYKLRILTRDVSCRFTCAARPTLTDARATPGLACHSE